MPDLNIEICGYPTAVSCAPGEEAHIHELVTAIQRHADSAAQIVGPDRLRQLLFAALFLAEDAASGAAPMAAAPGDGSSALAPLAARLSGVAERLQRVAAQVEHAGA